MQSFGNQQGPAWVYKTPDLNDNEKDNDASDDSFAGVNSVAISKEVHYQVHIENLREENLILTSGRLSVKSKESKIFVGDLLTVQDASGDIYRLDTGLSSQTLGNGSKVTLRFSIPSNSQEEAPGGIHRPTLVINVIDELGRPFGRTFKLGDIKT